MGLLLAVLLITWAFKKAVADSIVDNNLAKQGIVSPRMQARHGDQAGAKVDQYGMFDFFRDAWSDYWGRQGEALAAARTAPPPPGKSRVSLGDRLDAGIAKLGEGVQRAADSPAVRTLVDPVEPKPSRKPLPPEPPVVPVVDSGDVPEGTRRLTDDGWEEKYDGRWRPVSKQPDSPPAPPAPSTGGTMTAPTGEAVNYETTIAELTALADAQRGHLDQCTAALQQIESAKAAIGDMQDSYRASSAAAAATAEHLAAKNLDGVTLANAGQTVDAMPAGKVDEMFDQLEGMEAEAKQRLADAEIALTSTETNLQHIQVTYGDAYTTVTGNLGGDSSFLDSGGGAGGGNAGAGGGTPWATPPSGTSHGIASPTGTREYSEASGSSGSRPNVTVHNEPVYASGQAFGSGTVTNNGTGEQPPSSGSSAPDSGGQHSNRIVFNGPVDARNSHTGTGNVTNNN